jgi:hypothetical protein
MSAVQSGADPFDVDAPPEESGSATRGLITRKRASMNPRARKKAPEPEADP